jgi:hypothetical protein
MWRMAHRRKRRGSWSSGCLQSGSSGLSRSTFRNQGIAARGDLSRHFRLHPKHRADTRTQIARDAADTLAGGKFGLAGCNLGKPLAAVLQSRTPKPAAGFGAAGLCPLDPRPHTLADHGRLKLRPRGRHASRPKIDLLTGRLEGRVDLRALLPDSPHFVPREQTLHFDVAKPSVDAATPVIAPAATGSASKITIAPGPSAIVPYISTSLPPAAVTIFSTASRRLVFRFSRMASSALCLVRLRYSNQLPASGSPAVFC